MFFRVQISDTIRVLPDQFGKPGKAIINELRQKYVDKVIPNVGLCVSLFDIVDGGDVSIPPGDGAWHVDVEFRVVVFCPFRGEVLEGVVVAQSPDGIRLSLNFFDDIYVKPEEIFCTEFPDSKSHFDNVEKCWVWTVQDNAVSLTSFTSVLSFKVTSVTFHRQELFSEQHRLILKRKEQKSRQEALLNAPYDAINEAGQLLTVKSRRKEAEKSERKGGREVAAAAGSPVATTTTTTGGTAAAKLPEEDRGDRGVETLYIRPMIIEASMSERGLGKASWWDTPNRTIEAIVARRNSLKT